jgi:hypothetical protein
MYKGLSTKNSCADAWIAACQEIVSTGDEGYNIVIDVADAFAHSEKDNKVITHVDKFLRSHDKDEKINPIITVANTIFPQSLLEAHGPTDFYEIYHRDLESLSHTKQWGRYFQRMTKHVDQKGNCSNPLQDLIDKLKANNAKTKRKAVYELAPNPVDGINDVNSDDGGAISLYQPSHDRKRTIGGPCLSHLSFKLHPIQGVLLTAMYRNHYYITRLLGNLIGLGRLQAFVATQAEIPRGSLTIVSTHAELDTGNWGIVEARALVDQANKILHS